MMSIISLMNPKRRISLIGKNEKLKKKKKNTFVFHIFNCPLFDFYYHSIVIFIPGKRCIWSLYVHLWKKICGLVQDFTMRSYSTTPKTCLPYQCFIWVLWWLASGIWWEMCPPEWLWSTTNPTDFTGKSNDFHEFSHQTLRFGFFFSRNWFRSFFDTFQLNLNCIKV